MSVILREKESKNDLAFFVRCFCGENLWIHVTWEINKINAISKFSLKASSIRCALLKTCHINPLEYHKLYFAKVITTKKCIILFAYVSLKHHRSTKQLMEKNSHLEKKSLKAFINHLVNQSIIRAEEGIKQRIDTPLDQATFCLLSLLSHANFFLLQ